MSSAPDAVTGRHCKRGFLFFSGAYDAEELIEEFDAIKDQYETIFDPTPIDIGYDTGRVAMSLDEGDPMAYGRTEYEVSKLQNMGYQAVGGELELEGLLHDDPVFDISVDYDPESGCLETEASFYEPAGDQWRDEVLIDQLF